jgi:hypothetical protein
VTVKLAARKASNSALLRREQLTNENLRAAQLGKLFPDVGQLRIELTFHEPDERLPQPSAQSRTLYPAAPAFFRFACACTDCDGIFDLTELITAFLTKNTGRKAGAGIEGRIACAGTRFRDHTSLQVPCPMQLEFRIRVEVYRPA